MQPAFCSLIVLMADWDGQWKKFECSDGQHLWVLQIAPLYNAQLSLGPTPGDSAGKQWRAEFFHNVKRHVVDSDAEKAKAKVEWLIRNELRLARPALENVIARVKARNIEA